MKLFGRTLWGAVFFVFLFSHGGFCQSLDDMDNEPLIEIGGSGKIPTSAPKATTKTPTSLQKDVSGVATEELKTLAESGDAEAQFLLGQDCLNGKLVETNEEDAVKWLEMASKQNLPKAQTLLGTLYKEGIGVQKDYFQAIKLLRPAVEVGYLKANLELGMMYFDGKGVSRDHVEAFVLLNLASQVVDLEPPEAQPPLKKALELLSKELLPGQADLVQARIDELRDRILFRHLK